MGATTWRLGLLVAMGAAALACAGDNGAAGTSCTVKDNGDGTKTITCGTSTVTIADGKAGIDGSTCALKENTDGSKTIACGSKSTTVSNGTDGAPGKDGTDGTPGTAGLDGKAGTDGKDGAPGADGKPCTVADNNNGTMTISCPGDLTVTVSDGAPGKDAVPCTVKDNGDKTKTIICADGTSAVINDGAPGKDGAAGNNGADGKNGADLTVKNFHGYDALHNSGEYANGAKTLVKATITGASIDEAGITTVSFKVEDASKKPVTTLTSVSSNLSKLVPPAAGAGGSANWVPYLYTKATVSGAAAGGFYKPDGFSTWQPTSESNGTLKNNEDGTYTYTYKASVSAVSLDGSAVTYDPKLKHRVVVMMGGHAGPTADAWFDFVPDGSTVTTTRDIVQTAACKECHGPDFKAHGGNRLDVEVCVSCHNPSGMDPQSGNTLDLKVMLHKIHAGAELDSMAGADGKVFDSPTTPSNEMDDNGKEALDGKVYAIWGYKNTKYSWWDVGFPAIIENCTKCHQGAGKDVDAWKAAPSRDACGSCHDTVDWAAGKNHKGGKQTSDANCAGCHEPGTDLGADELHAWTKHDPRGVPEFTAKITVSAPKNGKFFTGDEKPVVTVVLDDGTGKFDHTTVKEDDKTKGGAEGCWAGKADDPVPNPIPAKCGAGDGYFAAASFFVHGPRAKRSPALTSTARVKILSTSAGPFALSMEPTVTLGAVFDGGEAVFNPAGYNGATAYLPAAVTLTVANSAFADKAKATVTEIATALNANAEFKARAIAYEDEATKKLGIRSRGKGDVPSVQLLGGALFAKVFGSDGKAYGTNASTASNNISERAKASDNDPKAKRFTDKITYELDAVTDARPGTYVIGIEMGDRYRVDGNNYVTPTVAWATFQIGVEQEEFPIARNCQTCHQNAEGKGWIVDPSRHNKPLRDMALDQCGSCHDYQPQNPNNLSTSAASSVLFDQGWQGAKPIARRVHAIHNGKALHNPIQTVWYSNGDAGEPGRGWRIGLPQDVRNCEVCHPAGTTSGTWATNPNRLACWGCHDSDYAIGHFKTMTYDPTPQSQWSGDEIEACVNCH